MEGVILSVGDDDVVHEVDAHHVTSVTDASREFFVGLAGGKVARGMVVTDGEDGGISQYSLADDDADIDGSLRDAPMGDAYFLDETVVLVEQ